MLKDERIGVLAHDCLFSILRAGLPIERGAIDQALSIRVPEMLAPTYRQAVRQRVTAALASYERNFREPTWRFVSDEPILEDIKLDLLWIRADGQFVADEIKTGINARLQYDAHKRQSHAQLAAGRDRFGGRFAGVRLLLLSEPVALFFASLSEGHK